MSLIVPAQMEDRFLAFDYNNMSTQAFGNIFFWMLEIFKVNSSSSILMLHTDFSLTIFHVMKKEIGMLVLEWDMTICTH